MLEIRNFADLFDAILNLFMILSLYSAIFNNFEVLDTQFGLFVHSYLKLYYLAVHFSYNNTKDGNLYGLYMT